MHAFARSARIHIHSRRGMLAILLLCTVLALLCASCTAPWQHKTVTTSGPGPKPTAQQILSTVQKNFHAVSSFHVLMKTANLGTAGTAPVLITNADGDVLMPDKLRAQASVQLSGQAVTVNLISIGPNQYITDPITGQWRVVKGVLDPRTLTNPDTGIISLAGKLQNVTGPTADTVNGVSCWRVDGLLNAQDLAFFTGGGVPKGTMLKTSIWAGQDDGLPYEVSVVGQATTGDTSQTSRTFFISKYNESLNIVAPTI